MGRHRILLLALFCLSCGSKPSTSSNVAVPSHRQQTSAQPQARIAVLAVPAKPEKPKEPISHQAAATIPGAQVILFAAGSPQTNEVFVLAQTSQDTYGGGFFVVRLDRTENQVEEVMGSMNLTDPETPVWSADGEKAYFVFDTEKYGHPERQYDHGLFAWDHESGKVTQIVTDSIGGLALTADGSLAAFWDYSAGDRLTVYDLKIMRVVRSWPGQVHSEDDLVISDLTFTPDGKSLLARLYAPDENAVMKYDIDSGAISPLTKDVQSLATVGDSIYFLQFVPVPFTAPEHLHKLMRWTTGALEPVTVLEDFHYDKLAGHEKRWLLGESRLGYGRGSAIYDTQTGEIQSTGKSCDSAVVTGSGRILYIFGNELVEDRALCDGPPPIPN
jgi:hypothetical protein